MFSSRQKDQYLARLELPLEPPSLSYLSSIQRQHLTNIPFENLDIHTGKRKSLDLKHIFSKIIPTNRGGYCFELNGLCHRLLQSLKFECYLTSASFWNEETQEYSMPLDHMMIIVLLEGTRYLIDVGQIDGTSVPKRIVPMEVTLDRSTYYKFEKDPTENYFLLRSRDQASFRIYYRTRLEERMIVEFLAANDRHQDDPESFFRKNVVVSRLNANGGRVVLTDKKIKREVMGQIEEEDVANKTQFYSLLEQHFAISRGDLTQH